MVKHKLEPTKNRSVRIPNRLWVLLDKAADDRGIYTNHLLWILVENFLVEREYMDNIDRKRLPLK